MLILYFKKQCLILHHHSLCGNKNIFCPMWKQALICLPVIIIIIAHVIDILVFCVVIFVIINIMSWRVQWTLDCPLVFQSLWTVSLNIKYFLSFRWSIFTILPIILVLLQVFSLPYLSFNPSEPEPNYKQSTGVCSLALIVRYSSFFYRIQLSTSAIFFK